jgi:hypothetical protein
MEPVCRGFGLAVVVPAADQIVDQFDQAEAKQDVAEQDDQASSDVSRCSDLPDAQRFEQKVDRARCPPGGAQKGQPEVDVCAIPGGSC